MGIIHLLSIIKAALCKILSLCSLAWITSVISQGSSTEGKMQRPSLKQDKLHSDCEELKEDLRQMQDISPSSMSRQFRFEEKVEKLESDLFGEKELWRTKFQELLQDQQSLKEQQQKCIHLEECKKSRHLMPPYGDVTDGVMESDINVRDGLHRRLGDQVKTSVCDCNNLTLLDGYKSLERPSLNRILPMPSTPILHPGSTNGWKTQKCFRVFAPRCPLDLKIGNRVKVILPSGRIGIGAVCKVGKLPGKVEFQVGVDLDPPECWQQVGVFKGQYNFHRFLTERTGYNGALFQEMTSKIKVHLINNPYHKFNIDRNKEYIEEYVLFQTSKLYCFTKEDLKHKYPTIKLLLLSIY